jgi:hypothetical protein
LGFLVTAEKRDAFMSTAVFSVMVGRAAQPTELAAYVQRLKRVEQGIEDLLAPIRWSSEIRLFRRVEPEGEEWLDVNRPGFQGGPLG